MSAEVAQTIERDGWGIEQIEERERQLLNWIQCEWG